MARMTRHNCLQKNQNGYVFISVLGLVAFIAIAGGALLGVGTDIFRLSVADGREQDARLANQRALALGQFLVANNLILCRQEGWRSNTDRRQKCRWGGNLSNAKITAAKYKLEKPRVVDGKLAFDSLMAIDNTNQVSVIRTELSFDLVDWSADALSRDMIGFIPNENSILDDDRFIVVINAKTLFRTPSGTQRTARLASGLRRPLPTPSIEIVGQPICAYACQSGTTENAASECRGPVEQPKIAPAPLDVRIRNLGPGAVYRLAYQRETTYLPAYAQFFGKPPVQAPTVYDALAAVNRDVILPGEDIPLSKDNVNCPNPGLITVTDPTSAVPMSIMQVPLFTYNYQLSVSPYQPELYDDPVFMASYDPFKLTADKKNQTISDLEPKRSTASIRPAGTTINQSIAVMGGAPN